MMNRDDLFFFTSWFENYAQSYSSEDMDVVANLRYKKEHSLRVRDYILAIGQDLQQLNEHEMLLAEVIGLFHDVGRFEQYAKYHTFKDHLSKDHADLGLSILEREKIFAGRVNESEKEIIYTAIKNHNQRVVAENVNTNTLMFCKLIRDADKLDIFDQIINFYENPLRTPHLAVESSQEDQNYSAKIIQGILSGQQISYSCVQSTTDIKLIRLSWLLDLSFPRALKVAQQRNYLARLWRFIPKTVDTLKVFQYIQEQLRSKTQ